MKKNILIGLLAGTVLAGGVATTAMATEANHVSNTNTTKNIILMAQHEVGFGSVQNGNGNLAVTNEAGQTVGYISVGQMLRLGAVKGNKTAVTVMETGVSGYVANANIMQIKSGVNDSVTRMNRRGTVINVTSFVHVRQEATMDSNVLANLTNKTNVTITGKQGEWYRVSVNGVKGFVYANYIGEGTSEVGGTVTVPSNVPVAGTTKGNKVNVDSSAIHHANVATHNAINTPAPSVTKTGKVVSVKSPVVVNPSRVTPVVVNHTTNVDHAKAQEVNNTTSNKETHTVKESNTVSHKEANTVKKSNTVSHKESNTVKKSDTTKVNKEQNQTPSVKKMFHAYVTNCKEVYLNSQPKANSTHLVALPKNAKVEVIGSNGDWLKVKFGNETGYIAKEFLTVNAPKSVIIGQSGIHSTTTHVDNKPVVKHHEDHTAPVVKHHEDNNTPVVKPVVKHHEDNNTPVVKPVVKHHEDNNTPVVKHHENNTPVVKPVVKHHENNTPVVKPVVKPEVKHHEDNTPVVKPVQQNGPVYNAQESAKALNEINQWRSMFNTGALTMGGSAQSYAESSAKSQILAGSFNDDTTGVWMSDTAWAGTTGTQGFDMAMNAFKESTAHFNNLVHNIGGGSEVGIAVYTYQGKTYIKVISNGNQWKQYNPNANQGLGNLGL